MPFHGRSRKGGAHREVGFGRLYPGGPEPPGDGFGASESTASATRATLSMLFRATFAAKGAVTMSSTSS